MANRTRKHTQHGVEVKQVEFSGNWYTVVDSRILIANHAKLETVRTQAGYSVIEHAMVPVGERWAYTCRIEYPAGSQHYYPGSDFIDLNAKDGLAKAETSAIGRALGLAGIAIEGGIASAEEMARTAFAPEMDEGERVVDAPVERRQPAQPQQQQPAAPKPAKAPQAASELASKPAPTDEQIDLAAKLRAAGMGIKAVRQFTRDHIGRELDAILLNKGRETLTMGETSKLLLELNKLANARQSA